MSWPAPTHDTAKAKAARGFSPGYSFCLRCGLPWRFVEEHQTAYSLQSSCFPLCESCWTVLTPVERVPYYRTLVIDIWGGMGVDRLGEWDQIEAAVRDGK